MVFYPLTVAFENQLLVGIGEVGRYWGGITSRGTNEVQSGFEVHMDHSYIKPSG